MHEGTKARSRALPLLAVLASAILSWASWAADVADARAAGIEAQINQLVTSPNGDVVTGRIDNPTAAELRDVRVLVTHSFLWKDERNPGDDNPGRSEVFVIDGPIPPHGSAHFRHEIVPPLPARSDGRYTTTASIVGLTTVGP